VGPVVTFTLQFFLGVEKLNPPFFKWGPDTPRGGAPAKYNSPARGAPKKGAREVCPGAPVGVPGDGASHTGGGPKNRGGE